MKQTILNALNRNGEAQGLGLPHAATRVQATRALLRQAGRTFSFFGRADQLLADLIRAGGAPATPALDLTSPLALNTPRRLQISGIGAGNELILRYTPAASGPATFTYVEDGGTGPVYLTLRPAIGYPQLKNAERATEGGVMTAPDGPFTYALTHPLTAGETYELVLEIDTYITGWQNTSTGTLTVS